MVFEEEDITGPFVCRAGQSPVVGIILDIVVFPPQVIILVVQVHQLRRGQEPPVPVAQYAEVVELPPFQTVVHVRLVVVRIGVKDFHHLFVLRAGIDGDGRHGGAVTHVGVVVHQLAVLLQRLVGIIQCLAIVVAEKVIARGKGIGSRQAGAPRLVFAVDHRQLHVRFQGFLDVLLYQLVGGFQGSALLRLVKAGRLLEHQAQLALVGFRVRQAIRVCQFPEAVCPHQMGFRLQACFGRFVAADLRDVFQHHVGNEYLLIFARPEIVATCRR